MQNIKITLRGKFWDSQLYMGNLYLFGLGGDLRIMNWDSLPEVVSIPPSFRYPFLVSFLRGDVPYRSENRVLLQGPEIKQLLQGKFAALADYPIEIGEHGLSSMTTWRGPSPFPFPHADSVIYDRYLYTVGRSGIFRVRCKKRSSKPIDATATKLWDCPVVSASASYYNLALAAGSEGLFEWGTTDYSSIEPHLVSKKNCTSCDWTYYSIYCSSDISDSYMASYFLVKGRAATQEGFVNPRVFERTIDETEIFGIQGRSWGGRDKICLVSDGTVDVVKYDPWKKRESNSVFEKVGSIHLEGWKGGVVSARVAGFGLVIECENAMVIVPSVGPPITIPEEPVNWRVFPRSKYYENQLHIIYDDRVEILSFSHDYFVDQREKLVGYMNPPERLRIPARTWRHLAPES